MQILDLVSEPHKRVHQGNEYTYDTCSIKTLRNKTNLHSGCDVNLQIQTFTGVQYISYKACLLHDLLWYIKEPPTFVFLDAVMSIDIWKPWCCHFNRYLEKKIWHHSTLQSNWVWYDTPTLIRRATKRLKNRRLRYIGYPVACLPRCVTSICSHISLHLKNIYVLWLYCGSLWGAKLRISVKNNSHLYGNFPVSDVKQLQLHLVPTCLPCGSDREQQAINRDISIRKLFFFNLPT